MGKSIILFGSGSKYKGHSLPLNSREKHFSIPNPHGQLCSFSAPMLHRVPAIVFLPSCFSHNPAENSHREMFYNIHVELTQIYKRIYMQGKAYFQFFIFYFG